MNLSSLTKKWHGIPVWALAAGTAVMIFLVYLYIRRRQANSSSSSSSQGAPSDATPPDSGLGNLPGDGSGIGSSFPGQTETVGPQPGQTTPDITINVPTPIVNIPPPVIPNDKTSKKPTVKNTPTSSGILVPIGATATSLETTVAKVGPSGVLVPKSAQVKEETNHPAAVKITANKTGGSANRAQGVFTIH